MFFYYKIQSVDEIVLRNFILISRTVAIYKHGNQRGRSRDAEDGTPQIWFKADRNKGCTPKSKGFGSLTKVVKKHSMFLFSLEIHEIRSNLKR